MQHFVALALVLACACATTSPSDSGSHWAMTDTLSVYRIAMPYAKMPGALQADANRFGQVFREGYKYGSGASLIVEHGFMLTVCQHVDGTLAHLLTPIDSNVNPCNGPVE